MGTVRKNTYAGRTDLEKLRRTRSQIHRQLDKLEPLLAGYQAKLAEVEAGIRAIAPELDIPKRFRDFRRGELPRFAMDVRRGADGPLPIRVIAVRVLAMKGIPLPGTTLRRRTRHRLRIILAAFDRRGVTSGSEKGTRRPEPYAKDRRGGLASAPPLAILGVQHQPGSEEYVRQQRRI